MVAPDDVSIKLVCEDGNRVVVDSVSIGRSQLLATLPCLPEEIPVPFSREQVAIWHAFSGENISTKSFTDCISALKVADFLQDQSTETAAVMAANASLFTPSRKRKLSAPRPKEASRSTIRSLKSLQPHLSHSVLREGGKSLEDFLRVLPASCIPLAVSAAVQHDNLEIHLDGDSLITDIFAAVRSLSVPVLSLKVVFNASCGDCTTGEEAAAEIATLTQLQRIVLRSRVPADVPRTLTALTQLRIEQSDVIQTRQLSPAPDVGTFRSLKELAIVNVWFSDFNEFSKQLPTLTALTSLQLFYPSVGTGILSLQQVPGCIGPRDSEAVAEGLSACTALASLTLCFPQTLDEFQIEHLLPESLLSHPHLSGKIIRALTALSSLTHLKFVEETHTSITAQHFEGLWQHLPQLLHLSIRSMFSWQAYIGTVRHLTELQSFAISSQKIVSSEQAGSLIQSLSDSLTSLELDCWLDRIPQLAPLTNLRSMRFRVCFRLGENLSSLTALTSLQMLSLNSPGFFPEGAVALLRALPACMTKLCLHKMTVPVEAVPQLSTLPALQQLDIGDAESEEQLLCIASHISSLVELRKFTVSFSKIPVVSSHVYEEVLRSLSALPHFEGVDAGIDRERLWSGI